MKKIGMILTPDVRSKAYLSKLVDNKIKLNQIIFMNDDREEKKFSNKEINQAKLYGIRIEKSVKTILNENYTHFKEFPFVDINNLELRNWRIDSWKNRIAPEGYAFPGDPRKFEQKKYQTAKLNELGKKLLGLQNW